MELNATLATAQLSLSNPDVDRCFSESIPDRLFGCPTAVRFRCRTRFRPNSSARLVSAVRGTARGNSCRFPHIWIRFRKPESSIYYGSHRDFADGFCAGIQHSREYSAPVVLLQEKDEPDIQAKRELEERLPVNHGRKVGINQVEREILLLAHGRDHKNSGWKKQEPLREFVLATSIRKVPPDLPKPSTFRICTRTTVPSISVWRCSPRKPTAVGSVGQEAESLGKNPYLRPAFMNSSLMAEILD